MANRRHSRCIAGVVISIVFLWSLSSCASVVGTASMEPGYVVNWEGYFWGGSRCSQSLTEVEVFLGWPRTERTDPSYYDAVLWHAVAARGQATLLLFDPNQPGVTVLSSSDTVPMDSLVYVGLRDTSGRWYTLNVVLNDLAIGQVAPGGPYSQDWSYYWHWPDEDFYC